VTPVLAVSTIVIVIVIAVVAALLLFALVAMYNGLVRKRNRSENAWAQVDVQLRKRYDLVPNLVETVKGYAAHEKETFEEVTKTRAAAEGAKTVGEQAQAENALTAALGRLMVVAEAYPQLRATENFQQLQGQLADVEQSIAVSRQVYNDTVLTYDNALETLPTSVIAGMFGFHQREYFQADGASREAPQVKFS
jgi:LemA protein